MTIAPVIVNRGKISKSTRLTECNLWNPNCSLHNILFSAVSFDILVKIRLSNTFARGDNREIGL